MAAAELSDDMISIKKNTLKLMIIDHSYREETYVIYRNGACYTIL